MKRKRKAPTVDAMMRFFLQYYNIATKQDIDKVLKRIDRLEILIKTEAIASTAKGKSCRRKAGSSKKRSAKGRAKMTATEKVVGIIEKSPKGIDVSALKTRSGFEDKKVRNIVFRLCKEGTIKRVARGVYAVV